MPRSILHLDMDAFYAAVEILDNPRLAGKPVIVGGTPEGRGVVGTASYEARLFGVRSAMPAALAVKLCPRGIFLPPRMDRYAAVSRTVLEALREFSPLVEPVSIDEAFLDLSGTEGIHGPPITAARSIKARVREVTGGLTASVGLAPNKFLAKVASDLRKPDGLVVVPPGGEEAFLAPLAVEKLWGVGPRTAEALHALGARRIGDLTRIGPRALRAALGEEAGRHLALLARGEDDRPVGSGGPQRSVSSETTFARFLPPGDLPALDRVLLSLSEDVASRLRALPALARRVTLKVRNERFLTRLRSRTLGTPTQLADELLDTARALLRERGSPGGLRVRLLGVAASELIPQGAVQLDLLDDGSRRRAGQVAAAVDRIREKMGEESVLRGTLIDAPSRAGGPRAGPGRSP